MVISFSSSTSSAWCVAGAVRRSRYPRKVGVLVAFMRWEHRSKSRRSLLSGWKMPASR